MDSPENQETSLAKPTRPSKFSFRRLYLITASVCLLVGVLLAGYYYGTRARKPLPANPDDALRVATEEADHLDPGWRLAELEAKRALIPDAENSALCVIAAHKLLPKDWPTWRSLDRLAGRELQSLARSRYEQAIQKIRPPVQLNTQQMAILKAELNEAEAALTEARKIADLPHGRLPPGPPSKSKFSSSNPHIPAVRKIMELLVMDARLRGQNGDLGNALATCRALLNTGRSVGDEPDSIALLVNVAGAVMTVQRLERVLAQGIPPAAALQQMQQLLEDEAEVPTLLLMARVERASYDESLQKIHDGTIPTKEIEKLDKLATSLKGFGRGETEEGENNRPRAAVENWYARERINGPRAWLLRYTTDFVEICKSPDQKQQDAFARLEATLKGQPDFISALVGSKGKVAEAFWRKRAQLRCAAVALAIERYRQANNGWPISLTELVPRYLASIPTDPYDGRPLRYCRRAWGVGVYSIGIDHVDNGGDFPDPTASEQAADMGFRLWKLKLRRLAPPAEQPLDELPGRDDE